MRVAAFFLCIWLAGAPLRADVFCQNLDTSYNSLAPLDPFFLSFLYTNTQTILISNANGVYVLQINQNQFQMFKNGHLLYSGAGSSESSLVHDFCPNGIVDPNGVIRFARPGPKAAVNAPVSGQAAGAYAYGDFNGDGVIDSAAVTSSGIAVRLYQASGAVLSSTSTAVGSTGNSGAGIVAADFNGDGVVDLALILDPDAAGQTRVAVLQGKGDGTFGAAARFPAGPGYLEALAAGDFNGDGRPDLAVANLHGQVAILLNRSDGTFSAPVSYAVGQSLYSIAAADFTGDGKLDLAVLDTRGLTGDEVWILTGKGDGTFASPIGTVANTAIGSLAYTDLNHDSKTDLLIADPGTNGIAVLAGNGDGTFQPAKFYVAAPQGTPASVGLIPLNDGHTALFTGDGITGNILVSFAANDGTLSTGALQFIGKKPSGIAVADLNGDARPDVVIVDGAAPSLYVLKNAGQGQLGSPAMFTLGGNAAALALADVNHDGKMDAVVAHTNGLDVLLGKGDGTFSAAQTNASSGALNSLAVADFNSDGKLDFAAANKGTGGLSLWLGNGDGTLRPISAVSLSGGGTPQFVAAGDLNGDGKPDLIAASDRRDFTTPATLSVLLGAGDGTFRPNNIALPGVYLDALALTDLNGDGKLDAVVALVAPPNNGIAVLLGNGDGTFKAPALINTRASGIGLTITDLDGDGIPDLVLGDCCGMNEASYLLGKGDGTFQPEFSFPSGPQPRGIAAADLEGHGKADLAIIGQQGRNNGGPQPGTLVLLGNGFPSAAVVVSAANPGTHAIAPDSLAVAYGTDLATSNVGATSVTIVDSSRTTSVAPLLSVSPAQVNFQVPAGLAAGAAQITIVSGDSTRSLASVQIAAVAPGIFTLNGAGLVAATALRVSPDGTQTPEQVYTVDNTGAVVANPIGLGGPNDQVYLSVYATGLRAAGTAGVQATIGGVNVPVQYAGPQGGPGLDQVNLIVPASLAGKGALTIQITASGVAANPVQIAIQ